LSQFPLALSALIFICLYVGLTTLIWFGPKDILRITSAILFGAYISTIFVSIAELCNAVILFKLSRKLGREFVIEKFKLKPKAVDKMQQNTSILGTMALRINPFVPFRLQDIGAGLSGMDFVSYIVGVAVVSPLRIFWLQYILADLGENVAMLFYAKVNFRKLLMQQDSVLHILKNHPFVQYLMDKPFILQYSCYYFMLVLVLSALALLFKLFTRQSRG
jgi:uncharacterized membrane protein YdjX (TVP38/TMEM64 family)